MAHGLVGLAEGVSRRLVERGESFDPDVLGRQVANLAWAGLRAVQRLTAAVANLWDAGDESRTGATLSPASAADREAAVAVGETGGDDSARLDADGGRWAHR